MEKHENELANMQDVYAALYKSFIDLNLNEFNNINEEENKNEINKIDEKLEQILDDLYDNAKLLEEKFQRLKDDANQIQIVNSNEDEYNIIQVNNINDSLIAIKNNIINLGRLYQYFTSYITKYGFKDINKSKE